MSAMVLRAGLQAGAPGGGATLTLEGWSVFLLLALLAAAGAGWAFYALSRRRTGGAGGVEPASPSEVAPADPLEVAFSAAAQGTPDGVLLCRGGRIVRAQGRASLLGDDPGSLAGLPFTALAGAEDVLLLAESLRSPAQGDPSLRFSLCLPRRPSARSVAARILRAPGGRGDDFVAVLSDVTAETAVARAASTVATRVSEALALLPEAVLITAGPKGGESVAHANPAAGTLFGCDPAELKGLTLVELRARAEGALSRSAAPLLFPDEAQVREERIRVEGAIPRNLERTVHGLGGGLPARLFIVRDVSASVTREEELRRAAQAAEAAWRSVEERQEQILMANEGLERRISDSARFNRELRAIDEMKSNFLANVSHELQTPLVSIRGYTEMILKGRMGPLTEEQERGLKVALRNVDRLIGLIDSLLSFVRTEKDAEPLRLEVFPLRQLVEEVMELLTDRAAERGVTINLHLPPGDMTIRADRNRIAQVFINLVGNAIKYNRHGGSVDIEASRGSRSTARVEIRDTGVGIVREELDKVFERFYRAASAGGEGSGLGLAITRDILRLHGCQIRADSEPGTGSVFSFTLPLEARGRSERAPRLTGSEREES